jgi:hypothetical protein
VLKDVTWVVQGSDISALGVVMCAQGVNSSLA